MTLTVQHLRLGHVDDREGALLSQGSVLVAVLSRLAPGHSELTGCWFLECSFGLHLGGNDIFPDLTTACICIEERSEKHRR